MKKDDLPKVSNLDKTYFKASRNRILEYVFTKASELCYVAFEQNKLIGYLIAKKRVDSLKIGQWIVKPRYIAEAEALLQSFMNERLG